MAAPSNLMERRGGGSDRRGHAVRKGSLAFSRLGRRALASPTKSNACQTLPCAFRRPANGRRTLDRSADAGGRIMVRHADRDQRAAPRGHRGVPGGPARPRASRAPRWAGNAPCCAASRTMPIAWAAGDDVGALTLELARRWQRHLRTAPMARPRRKPGHEGERRAAHTVNGYCRVAAGVRRLARPKRGTWTLTPWGRFDPGGCRRARLSPSRRTTNSACSTPAIRARRWACATWLS